MRKSIVIYLITVICLIGFSISVFANDNIVNPNTGEAATKHNIKVLVIEINPVLKSQNNLTAFDYEKWPDKKDKVNQMITDFKECSHNLLNYEVEKWEYLNEFPLHKNKLKLKNGTEDYRMDEETWLNIMSKSPWWASDEYKQVAEKWDFSFNYEDLIDRLNLVDRRNNGEFDQVWLLSPALLFGYESLMVGKTAYWINGPAILRPCKNFALIGMTSRWDTNIEAFGHMAENILMNVYDTRLNGYDKMDDKKSIEDMNTWEKFVLNETSYPGHAAVGNVHFAPNSLENYDWWNTTYVQSTWVDWDKNYPNLTGESKLSNMTDWQPEGTEAPRQHHKWWFSLMPHVGSRDKDGYSHSWWDYLATLDYATSISFKNDNLTGLKVGDTYTPVITAKYQSGDTNNVTNTAVLTTTNSNVVKIENRNLVIIGEGNATITAMLDGRKAQIPVNIKQATNNAPSVVNDLTKVIGNGSINIPKTTNKAPKAINDNAVVARNGSVNINVKANDTDPDKDALTVTSLGTASHGKAVINSNNTVKYTPKTGYSGTDTFTYTISDGKGGTSTGKVYVKVTSSTPKSTVKRNPKK